MRAPGDSYNVLSLIWMLMSWLLMSWLLMSWLLTLKLQIFNKSFELRQAVGTEKHIRQAHDDLSLMWMLMGWLLTQKLLIWSKAMEVRWTVGNEMRLGMAHEVLYMTLLTEIQLSLRRNRELSSAAGDKMQTCEAHSDLSLMS